MNYHTNPEIGNKILPMDIVLAPEWWFKKTGITFDRDFFFHPKRRIEAEQKMEKELYKRWGKYGFGLYKDTERPEVGAVHLAAGFLLSEMLGCQVNYSDSHPPQVIPACREDFELKEEDVFKSLSFFAFKELQDSLKKKFGYLTGDINWGGILNLALDLRGENIFTEMMMNPDITRTYFIKLGHIIEKFTCLIQNETGSSSISVNRVVRHIQKPVFLHSECSHTMISCEDYEKFLLPFDIEWSKKRPFGIHYCGPDPHRMVASFSKIPHLDFLDVGWGGDIKELRKNLPNTFLNIRLSPVEIIHQSIEEIRDTVTKLVHDSNNPYLTGICCINMDDTVSDDKITAIFETVEVLKNKYIKEIVS